MTNAGLDLGDWLEQMYDEAFEPFRVDTGTQYLSKQDELDRHWNSVFKYRNKGPFVSSIKATEDMINHNDLRRRVPSAEAVAIRRLQDLISHVKRGGYWGPDVAVKAFRDLDLVFFGGKLNGHVCIIWDDLDIDAYGVTQFPGDAEADESQSHIVLNADLIFDLENGVPPFMQMMHTLLHEMVHALDTVRCPHAYDWEGDGHDRHFETRISAVHERAKTLLGMVAVGPWEPYRQCHFFYKAQRPGLHWSFGHVRSTRNEKGHRSKGGKRRDERRDRRKDVDDKACVVM